MVELFCNPAELEWNVWKAAGNANDPCHRNANIRLVECSGFLCASHQNGLCYQILICIPDHLSVSVLQILLGTDCNILWILALVNELIKCLSHIHFIFLSESWFELFRKLAFYSNTNITTVCSFILLQNGTYVSDTFPGAWDTTSKESILCIHAAFIWTF